MSYSTGNPPYMVVAAVAGGANGGSSNTAGNLWAYKSSDPMSVVVGSSYVSNGYKLGMRLYDPVMVFDTTNGAATWAFVTAVTTSMAASQGGGGATIGTRFSTGS